MLRSIQRMAEQLPNQIAIEEQAGCLTYLALWQAIQQTSASLRALKPQVVAIDLPNGSAWIIVHLACIQAGIAQVPIPPFFTPEQRTHAMRDAGVDLLLNHGLDIEAATLGAGRVSIQAHRLHHPAVTLPKGTAIITYTSGSTGNPKGVCLSQEGMETVANSLIQVLGSELALRHLCVLPLAVLLEQVGGLYATFLAGGTYIIGHAPIDGDRLSDALQESKATSCILVPEMLKTLLHACQSKPANFKHLRFVAVGGARVPDALLLEAQRYGLPVYQGYGLSESASVVAVNVPGRNRLGTVGEVLPHIAYSIAKDGEIILHRPAMLGYTGGAVCHGNYATGDMGAIDNAGFLTIRGRKKNVLITGYGRNVSPEWPESALLAQPEIAQAMVYGDGEACLSALIVAMGKWDDATLQQAVIRANQTLPDYAQIGAWQRVAPFTQSNGLLTGTGRIRREAILQFIEQQKELNHGFLRTASA